MKFNQILDWIDRNISELDRTGNIMKTASARIRCATLRHTGKAGSMR